MTATARQILRANADGTPEWLAQRTQGIGGTNAAELVLGLKSRFALWREKRGLTEPETITPGLQALFDYGHSREPEIRRMFAERTGQRVRNTGTWIRKDAPWAIANPDGLVGRDGILEIKTSGPFTDAGKEWKAGQIPARAMVQATWYAWVMGRTELWFAAEVYRQLYTHGPVRVDFDLVESMVSTVTEFWASVEAAQEPAPAPADATLAYPTSTEGVTVALDPWSDTATALENLRDLKTRAAELDKQIAARTDEIKLAMGEAELLVDHEQRVVATWKSTAGRRTLDRAALKTAGIDPEEYMKVGKPSRRFELKEQN